VQTDRLRDQAAAAQARERHLVEQIQQLAMQAGERSRASAAPPATVNALLRRPDLIPLEPVLGGTFYFLEDSVVQLSDRYVYATVEDGHIRGHVLLLHHGGERFEVIHAHAE
jgi:hypothetical protein